MATVYGTIRVETVFNEQVSMLTGSSAFNYSLPNLSRSLSGNSTPDITQVYAAMLALSGGALTIDLTSLTRTGRTALDLDGLAVHGLRIQPLGANDMTIVEAASNGFTGIFPATTATPLKAGETCLRYSDTSYGTVGATNKDFTLAGTGNQMLYFQIWAGAAA